MSLLLDTHFKQAVDWPDLNENQHLLFENKDLKSTYLKNFIILVALKLKYAEEEQKEVQLVKKELVEQQKKEKENEIELKMNVEILKQRVLQLENELRDAGDEKQVEKQYIRQKPQVLQSFD